LLWQAVELGKLNGIWNNLPRQTVMWQKICVVIDIFSCQHHVVGMSVFWCAGAQTISWHRLLSLQLSHWPFSQAEGLLGFISVSCCGYHFHIFLQIYGSDIYL